MKMKNIKTLITLIALVAIVTSCMNEEIEGLTNKNESATETSSVITLTTDCVDGIINLSVDAPHNSQANLWIDLNGDGERAQDGTEDIKVFNSYQAYRVTSGLESVSLYGDITYLGSASNELTAIDISENPYLTTLNVPLNKLSVLEVSKNSALTHLDLSGNNIHALDVSQNRALVSLWVFNNSLTQLDLSNNSNLVFLDFSGNQLSSIDVSKNNELVRLIGFNNQLTSLDISQNDKLNRLWMFGNPLSNQEAENIIRMTKEVGDIDLWITDTDNM